MTREQAMAAVQSLPHDALVALWLRMENGCWLFERTHARFYGEMVTREHNADYAALGLTREVALFPRGYDPNTERFVAVA